MGATLSQWEILIVNIYFLGKYSFSANHFHIGNRREGAIGGKYLFRGSCWLVFSLSLSLSFSFSLSIFTFILGIGERGCNWWEIFI